jgi:hypothetical protein
VSTNVFACLVHEAADCVVDLVDNLRFLDPDSVVLLYDGGKDPGLLRDTGLDERDGVVIHPEPRPMAWGTLHGFAFDCMRYARDQLDFSSLTIVDSDQLALRPGYSAHLADFLKAHPAAGCLVNEPLPQPPRTRVGPAQAAWREVARWRPYLRRFPGGERKFPHWTFWPSTVFTRAAAVDLLDMWADEELRALVAGTRIWATEEIILPTLVALAGHEIVRNPCSYDLVRYRVSYRPAQIDAAAGRADVFWAHPIPRRYDDPLRARIRRRFGDYVTARSSLPLLLPLLKRMEAAEGRLTREEADLLVAAARQAPPGRVHAVGARPRTTVVLDGVAGQTGGDGPIGLLVLDKAGAYAEIAARMAELDADVADGGLVVFLEHDGGPSFADHLAAGGGYVPVQRVGSATVVRKEHQAGLPPIGALVERMTRVQGWLEPDEAALLAMTAAWALRTTGPTIVEVGSYCGRGTVVLAGVAGTLVHAVDPFDGIVGAAGAGLVHTGPTLERFTANVAAAGLTDSVRTHQGRSTEIPWAEPIALLVVDGLHDQANVAADFEHFAPSLAPGGHVAFHDYADYFPGVRAFVGQLLRRGGFEEVARAGSLIVLRKTTTRRARSRRPLVTCVMPTYNRRAFVPQAISYFTRQDYPDRELIVVDDGTDPVADLIPDDPAIRYVRLPARKTIGAKRNIACEQARGEIIVHWDDDDWMADWRLRYQVEAFLGQDVDVSGLSAVFFCDVTGARSWRYQYPSGRRPWVHDPTFCYRRQLWASAPFPDTSYGLDSRYLWQGPGKRIGMLDDPSFYVGIVHGGNTSRKNTADPWWRPYPTDEIAAMMGRDWTFYRAAA